MKPGGSFFFLVLLCFRSGVVRYSGHGFFFRHNIRLGNADRFFSGLLGLEAGKPAVLPAKLCSTLFGANREMQAIKYSGEGMLFEVFIDPDGRVAGDNVTHVCLETEDRDGFIGRCLAPVSLRDEIVPPQTAARIRAWRSFFLGVPAQSAEPAVPDEPLPASPLVDAGWLEEQLSRPDIRVLDVRSQPEYNTSHVQNSIALNIESLRANMNGVGSMLQPAGMLAGHMSAMGIGPTDTVVILYGDKSHDATLAGIALERLGHASYMILNGGFAAWKSSGKPLVSDLPDVAAAGYPVVDTDRFTVDYTTVLEFVNSGEGIILDVRPADYYNGLKSEEARAGHIPGAINRPYTEDLVTVDEIMQFKPVEALAEAYSRIIPSKDSVVVVHCRTGHQASQTFFVLKRLLGYKNVLWYDAGWSQWAARKELPVSK